LAEKSSLSIIVPVLDEEETVPIFLDRVIPMLETVCREQLAGGTFEIIFIDDGSTDRTAGRVVEAAESRQEIKLVRFSRNFGKEAALAAGLHYASGDAAIPMDVDLQDPPEVVPEMVAEWLKGAEVVNAIRRRRDSDTPFRRWMARTFYRLYNTIADLPIKPDVGDFRLLDRAVVDALNRLSEGSRFTKALYSWVGYRNVDIEYDRAERSSGDTKWGFGKLFRFAIDGITASTSAPLRVWSYVGLFIGLAAFVYAGIIAIGTLTFGNDVPGYSSLMVVILLLGGLNLLSLGVMGEYVGRIAQEVRNRPLFVVRDTHGVGLEQRDATSGGRPPQRIA
jgi:glycosyltransferase involved in cell wall biosynthesis